ncbi:IclR family transcriptional regulator [uncultured Agrobacterium sp.]|uniref:IclR family transcriptional regulator n=1 Tax=uncultured Agrobacterium sp. TaxID=157277 RepID=UPI0025D89713|nr:IclR family transcriptional regulator [uncultured Agrobacterium sp.]
MQNDEPDSSSAQTVPALRRAVAILDILASGKNLTAAEIARTLSLPKSTAHGLLAVMGELDLVGKSPDGTLKIGPHPLRWANAFLSQLDIVTTFQEVLARDRKLDPYTVTLTVREGAEVVYVGCRNSDQPLGQTFRIGMRLPAPFTATGKILLSDLKPAELDRLLTDFPKPLTPRSVGSVEELKRELEVTRKRGFSVDDGQIREGMICIGAPLRDHSGAAVAGIAISILRSEASDDKIAELGAQLQAIAQGMSEGLGGG